MGKVGAFLELDRVEHNTRPSAQSIKDYDEFALPLSLEDQCKQASRCMNCGVGFCQSGIKLDESSKIVGCPLHNLIPETNDLFYKRRYEEAIGRLALTNPFPEFTGRVCPAPCETACNLGLHQAPVTINDNERALSDLAWELHAIKPLPKASKDAPLVCIIGSGPAGLCAAWDMARKGWRVRVYEKDDRPGGLLMYGIPNMKLPKWVVTRRIDLMKDSGIDFVCDYDAAEHANEIASEADAVIIASGANVARDVDLPGRNLAGIHFALDYLSEVTRAHLEDRAARITAKDKDVIVLGGGDTGCDCVACALRQGAKSVTQVIRAKRLPQSVNAQEVWPDARSVYTQGYGQREAAEVLGNDPRRFSTDTIEFVGKEAVEGVVVKELSCDDQCKCIEGITETLPAQLVLIAKGFIGTDNAIFDAFNVEPPDDNSTSHQLVHKNLGTSNDATPIYIAGDAKNGATLVVSAMADALACTEEIMNTQ